MRTDRSCSSRRIRRWAGATAVLLMLACLPAAAPADAEYGKGTLVIKMKDDDWATNYLLRTEAAMLFPMTDILNLKFALLDEYNNQPAPDATHKNLATTLGLSLVY